MDLALTESQEMLKSAARTFMERECSRQVLLDLDRTETGISPEIWGQLARMGWLGLAIPAEYGGEGAGLLDTAIVYEQLGRGPLGGPHFSSAVLGGLVVLECGTEDQRREVLPRVAAGEQVLALAYTEPDYGWGPESVKMAARRDGSDYILDGVKLFVHDAAAATHLLCVARTGDGPDPTAGLSVFLVDRSEPGVSVRTLPGFMAGLCEVRFEGVRVPAGAVLGELGAAWPGLSRAFLKAIPVLCAYKVGATEAVFEMSVSYSQTRVQFGQPIGRFQRVQDHIIDIVNYLDSARWTTYEAIWKLETGRPAEASVHLAKAVASESFYRACNSAHEVHAGIGSVRNYGLVLFTKASRSLYNYLGDPKFHKRRLADALEL
jgi:alkylation response protein AidB-like acyl-CoA dehydrogenase